MATPAGGGGAGFSPGVEWLDAASPAAGVGAAAGDGAAAFSSPPLQSLSANAVALPPSARSSKLRLTRRSDGAPPSQVASLSGAQLSAAVALGLAVAPAPAAAAAAAAAALSAPLQRAQLAPPVLPTALRPLGANGPMLFEAQPEAALMPVLGSESDDDDAPNFDLGIDHVLAPPQQAPRVLPPAPLPRALLRSPTPSPPLHYSPPPSTAARRRPPRAPLLGDDDVEELRHSPDTGFVAVSDSDTPLPIVLPPARRTAVRRASQRLSQRLSQGGGLPWDRASQDSEPLPVVGGLFSDPRPPRPQKPQPPARVAPPPQPPPPAHGSDEGDEEDDDDDDGFAIAPRRTLKRLRRVSAPVVILSDSEDEPLAQQPRPGAQVARGQDSDGVEEISDDSEDGSDAAEEEGHDEELAEDDADWDDAAGAAGGGGAAGGEEWETWGEDDEFGAGGAAAGGDDDYDFGAGRDASEVEEEDDFRVPPSRTAAAQQAAPRSVGRAALQFSKPAAGASRVPEPNDDDDDEVQIVEPPEEPWRARLPHLVTCAQIERSGFRIAGERVHIDYRRQFGGVSRVSATAGQADGGGSAKGRSGGDGGAASRTPKQARWLTEDGKKVFKTADGRTLTGSKAYKEYQKQAGGGGSRARHDEP